MRSWEFIRLFFLLVTIFNTKKLRAKNLTEGARASDPKKLIIQNVSRDQSKRPCRERSPVTSLRQLFSPHKRQPQGEYCPNSRGHSEEYGKVESMSQIQSAKCFTIVIARQFSLSFCWVQAQGHNAPLDLCIYCHCPGPLDTKIDPDPWLPGPSSDIQTTHPLPMATSISGKYLWEGTCSQGEKKNPAVDWNHFLAV